MATTLERLTRIWETPPGLFGRLATVDHKTIGKRYLITAFAFLLLGGLEAALLRWQLALPDRGFLSPEAYDQLFSMHGTTMIFWYAAPVLSGFSNYLFPLMLGARDMAFPRLNAFGYWVFLFSGIFLYSSFLVGQAPDGGWFAYVPLTGPRYSPGLNLDYYALGLLLLGISTTAGAINFIVTAFRLRAPGMSLGRMPLFIWGTLTTSVSVLFALPSLTVACAFLFLDRRFGTHFFDPAGGGNPLLWQHLFWVFGHPWVYIVVLPAMSMVSMILPTFCRRPIVGYAFVAMATVATGILGFGVWAHHMFAAGLSHLGTSFFSAASMAIAIPSAVSIFAWLATLWEGRPVLRTPFLFVLGFLVLFTIGGVSGVVTASVPFDWQVTDTYFVVAHLHYVLVGMNLFPVVGALYYWLPKMTGRMLDERLGRWSFWVMFVGFNLGFFPMHVLGLLGMPRRVYTYASGLGWDTANLLATAGSYVFAAGVLLFLVNLARSLRRGEPAGDNPWDAGSLEWATTSPPAPYNFAPVPVIESREPLWEERLGWRPSSRVGGDPALAHGHEAWATSALDALPERVLLMPGDSLWPLVAAVSLLAVFYAALGGAWVTAGAACAVLLVAGVAWLWPPRSAEAA